MVSFGVDNLPLAAGTNIVNISAVDGWGNSEPVEQTLVITQSTIGLSASISSITKKVMDISGTVGASGYHVWINDIEATNVSDASGSWTATNVSIPDGGTVTFTLVASPSSSPNDANAFSTTKEVDAFRTPYVSYAHEDLSVDAYNTVPMAPIEQPTSR